MTKIKFTKKSSRLSETSDSINIYLEIEPFSFDTTGFEPSPSPVIIKSIKFIDFKDKYQANGLGSLLESDKKEFELDFDKDRTQFWVIRRLEGDVIEKNKLHIDLYTSSGHLSIGSPGGFMSDIATLAAVAEEPPTPPKTVRKHCNECQKGTLHLEVEGEEQCLPCEWENGEDYWKNMIEEHGFDQAKKEWETIRDSEANEAILQELNDEEKQQWLKVVVPKIDKIFVKKQNEEQPFNYLSYALAIGGMLLVVVLFIFFSKRKNKNR